MVIYILTLMTVLVIIIHILEMVVLTVEQLLIGDNTTGQLIKPTRGHQTLMEIWCLNFKVISKQQMVLIMVVALANI